MFLYKTPGCFDKKHPGVFMIEWAVYRCMNQIYNVLRRYII